MLRVTLKGLAAHKLRFVMTAIAVMIGVAFLSGTLVFTDTIRQTFDDLFANIYRNTDAVVRAPTSFETTFGDDQRPRIPGAVLQVVRSVPGVKVAEAGVDINYAQLVDKNGDAIGNPGQGAPTFGLAWGQSAELNPFRIAEGRPPRTASEIVIDKHSADRGKLHVGDRVDVLTADPPQPYTIAGVARFGTADSPAGASVVLFTPEQAQRVAHAQGQIDRVSVVAQPGISQEQIKARLQQALLPGDVEVLTGQEITKENQDLVGKQLRFFELALSIFAFIALLVSIFIIYNTFNIIVAQRTRELALLRAIGASGRQVLQSVLGESIVVGLLASGVGILGGILISTFLKALLAAVGIDIPSGSVVVKPNTIIIGLVVGSVVTVLSAALPARKAARIAPIAALRDVAFERPPNVARRIVVGLTVLTLGVVVLLVGLFGDMARRYLPIGVGALLVFAGAVVLTPLFARALARALGAPLRVLKGMTGTLARENAARNPKRTAVTAAALMLGVTLVGFITIFASSAKASVSQAIDEQLKVDYIIGSGAGFGTGLSPALGASIKALPEIQSETALRFGPAQIDGAGEFLFAVDPKATVDMFDFDTKAGNFATMSPRGIAVSEHTAKDKGWRVGDAVAVLFAQTGTVPLTIDAIYDGTQIVGNYVISMQGFEQNFADQIDYQVFAKLKPGVSAAAGRAAIEPLLARYPTAKLMDEAEYKEDQEAQINQIVNLIYGLLFLAIVVAVIGIANTLALSVYERTREIGLLRAVGMTRSQVRSAVRWESVIIALLGTVLGLGLGLFFGWTIVASLKSQGFSRFAAAPGQLAVVVILAAIVGIVAAWLPARRAAKLDILRAIGTE
jgi:putative ABC transport system permease protein